MHPFRALVLPLCCVCAVLFVTGCGRDNTNQEPLPPDVQATVAHLMDAIKAGNYEQAVKYYDESFFTNSAPELWRDKLKQVMSELGPMKSYSLAKTQADTRFSGTFYILEYNSVHDGNKRLHHTITLVAPVNGDPIKLVGHKLTPWEAKDKK